VHRIAAALHIHDIEIAELFVTDPYLRHSVPKRPILADDELWAASTAEEWTGLMVARQCVTHSPQALGSNNSPILKPTPMPKLHTYIELEGIAASIIESNNQGMHEQPPDHLIATLINLYTQHLKPHPHTQTIAPDPFCLLALWHSTFISACTTIDTLELAIGKEGSHQAISEPVTGYVRGWADSPSGQRAALHAALILGYLRQLPLATEPAIHVPRVIFRAAIVWYCYTEYHSRSRPDLAQPQLQQQHQQLTARMMQFPEFREMGASCHRVLFDAVGFRSGMVESSTFSGLIDLLERLGHWGISTRLAGILRLLLPDGDEEER
jgi:hypothetical protein